MSDIKEPEKLNILQNNASEGVDDSKTINQDQSMYCLTRNVT